MLNLLKAVHFPTQMSAISVKSLKHIRNLPWQQEMKQWDCAPLTVLLSPGIECQAEALKKEVQSPWLAS
jgi:hypothetical protein